MGKLKMCIGEVWKLALRRVPMNDVHTFVLKEADTVEAVKSIKSVFLNATN